MAHKMSSDRLDKLQDKIDDVFDDAEIECTFVQQHGELTVTIDADDVLAASKILLNTKAISMEQCIDVCGVDYSTYGQAEWDTNASSSGFSRAVSEMSGVVPDNKRFAVVYHLLSLSNNVRVRVKVWLDEDYPVVDSVTDVWSGVDWFEREAFDLYGIMFKGHNDLRRILTDYGFNGHPFRKDFPLIGEVEMRYDAEQQRVIYEKVQIEDRTLVPRVVREDNRYDGNMPLESVEQEPDDA